MLNKIVLPTEKRQFTFNLLLFSILAAILILSVGFMGTAIADDSGDISVSPEDGDGPEWGDIGAQVTEVGATYAVIELDDIPEDAEEIVAFRVLSDTEAMPVTHVVEGLELFISELEPETEYDIKIEAVDDEENMSVDGPTVSFTTESTDEFGWPDDAALEVTSTTDQSATLTWDAAVPAELIDWYYLNKGKMGETPTPFANIERTSDGEFIVDADGTLTEEDGTFTYETDGILTPDSEYEFQVIAQLGDQMSDPLSAFATTGDAEVPEWDDSVRITVDGITEETATVTVGEYPIREDLFDELVFYDEGGEPVPATRPDQQNDLEYELTGLVPDTTQEITIEVRDVFGQESTDGPTETFTTEPTTSARELSLEAFQTSVTLSWDGPETGTYHISRDNTEIGTVAADDGDFTYVDTGLEAEQLYEYEIIRSLSGEDSDPISETVVTGVVGATVRTSLDSDGSTGTQTNAWEAEISGDGQYVVYSYSQTEELSERIYLHDLQTGERIEITPYGESIDWNSYETPFVNPAISGDGQFVAFASQYGDGQVFVRDVEDGSVELISGYDEEGVWTEGDQASSNPTITADGRYVGFESQAANLVEGVEGNNIFVYDRQTGEMTAIESENEAASANPAISPDGSYVTFESDNHDLGDLPDDLPDGQTNVFMYDLDTGEIEWISQPFDGATPQGDSTQPAISENGEQVVFLSDATELTADSISGSGVYHYDRTTETLELLSVSRDGTPFSTFRSTTITPDGQYVAFDRYRVNTETGLLSDFGYNNSAVRWERSFDGDIPAARDVSISDDGAAVSYRIDIPTTGSTNVVADDDSNANSFVTFLGNETLREPAAWDEQSVETSDVQAGELRVNWDHFDEAKYYYVYVDDTLYSTESSQTTEIGIESLRQGEEYDFRVEAMNKRGILSESGPAMTGTTAELTAPSSIRTKAYDTGVLFEWTDDMGGGDIWYTEFYHAESGDDPVGYGDARTQRFLDTDLDPETTYDYEVEFWDEYGNYVSAPAVATTLPLGAGIETEYLDRDENGEPFDGRSGLADMTPDGELAVIETRADPLGLPTEAGSTQVFLRNTESNSIELISRPDGTGPDDAADGNSGEPHINDDGSTVIFGSYASNLDAQVPDVDSGLQLYLRDRNTDTTTLLTQNNGEVADEGIRDFDVSADGNLIVFTTDATNLVDDVTDDDRRQAFLYNRLSGELTLISTDVDGQPANNFVNSPKISESGSHVVFRTSATNLVEDVTNDQDDIYRYSVETGELKRVSVTPDGEEIPDPDTGSDNARTPAITADGSEVMFLSQSEAMGSDGDDHRIFSWDEETGVTEIISVNPFGAYEAERSFGLSVSSDGRFVGFGSETEGMVPRQKESGDLHLYVYDRVNEYTMRGDVNSSGERATHEPNDNLLRLVETNPVTLLYSSSATNLDEGLDGTDRVFRTSFERFDAIADVDPPSWPPDAEIATEPVGQTAIELNWDTAVHEIGIDSYIVGVSGLDEDITVSGDDTGTVVTGLETDTTYTFEIHAVDAAGRQSPVLTATETTLSEADLVPLFTATEGGLVTVEWEPATEASGIEGYLIQHRVSDTGSNGDWVDRETIDQRETGVATDTGLESNTTYEYRVLGLDTDGETVAYTTTERVETSQLSITDANWLLTDGNRVGEYVTPGSTLGVTILGEPNWNATVAIDYRVWDDPESEEPLSETETLELEEDDENPGRYDAEFVLPDNTAMVAGIDAFLADTTRDITTPVPDLPATVFADVQLDTVWPDDVPFPDNARLSLWSSAVQDGDITPFDEDRTYEFDQLDAGEDLRTDYRVRIQDRFSNQILYEEFLDVRAGISLKESITDPLAPASLNVNVEDPDGELVSGVRIRATDTTTDRSLGTLISDASADFDAIADRSRLLADEEIELSLSGRSAEPYRFDTEQVVTLDAGENNVTFSLEEWGEPVTLSGTITNEDGEPVAGTEVTGVQRFGERFWDGFVDRATTNADGEYSLSVKTGGEVSLSAAYRPETDEIGGSAETTVAIGSDSTVADLTLTSERHRTIELTSIRYLDADGSEQVLGPFGRSEAAGTEGRWPHRTQGLSVTVSGDSISDWTASRTGSYPYTGWIADGEEVTVCASTWAIGVGGSHCGTVLLDEDSTDVGVELDLEAEGAVAGTVTGEVLTPDGTPWEYNSEEGTSEWSASLYEKDGTGYSRIRTLSGDVSDIEFNLADSGEYRLRLEGTYRSVAQSTELHFELGEESSTVELEEIHMSSDGIFGFQSGNMISGPSDAIMPGYQGTVRLNYENTAPESISDVEVNFELPEELSYVDNSISHDGDALFDTDAVTVEDGTVTAPLGALESDDTGSLRFEVAADADLAGQNVEIPATITYDDDGSEEEWLGTANVGIGTISMFSAGEVGEQTISVDGRAPGESTVAVYADDVRVGETTAAPNGYWSLSLDLPDEDAPHSYDMQAIATTETGSSQESAVSTVTYDPETPALEQVRFRQSDDPDEVANLPPRMLGNIDTFLPATSDVVGFTPGPDTRFPRTMLAGLSFEFELDFDRPTDVDNVYVFVDGAAGGIGEAVYNQTANHWEVAVETDRLARWSLDRIYVATNVPEDDAESLREGPTPSGALHDEVTTIFSDYGSPIANPAWKIDPSGYVYEVERDNTIEGVTATVFELNETSGKYEEWDAEWWGEENPQQTDAAGWYGWDVPEGDWRVVYEKDGYETAYSEDIYGEIEVPPPRFDVDIPLKSLEPPAVETVNTSADGEAVTVEFDRHLDTATVSSNTVFIQTADNSPERIDAQLVFPETVVNPHTDSDSETLSKSVRIEPDERLQPGEYEVVVRELVESYAAVPVQQHEEIPIELSSDVSFDITIESTNSPITEGETLSVEATVENIGDTIGTETIQLLSLDGSTVDQQDIELDRDEGDTITLQWDTVSGDAATGAVTVQGSETADTVEITIDADESDDGPSEDEPESESRSDPTSDPEPDPTPPSEPEDDLPQPPTGVDVVFEERVKLELDEESGTTRATFSDNSPVESITFTSDVAGDIVVRTLDQLPDETRAAPGRTVSLTQIVVPPELENTSATIQKRVLQNVTVALDVQEDHLQMARYTGEWGLLDTTVENTTADSIRLSAMTPGFSLFAVSAVSEPDAVINGPSVAEHGIAVEFDGSSSDDRYGEVVNYEWSLGNVTTTGETMMHTFDESGTYDVKLTVENDAGIVSSTTHSVTVEDPTGDEQEDADDEDDSQSAPDDETGETDDGDDQPAGSDDSETPPSGDAHDDSADDSGPGFGVVLPIVGLVAFALLFGRAIGRGSSRTVN